MLISHVIPLVKTATNLSQAFNDVTMTEIETQKKSLYLILLETAELHFHTDEDKNSLMNQSFQVYFHTAI